MSLRLRLIGLIVIALVVSLALGVAIACFTASRSVGTEMRSALLLGRRVVENSVEGIQASGDPRHAVERLVALFRDNRHLRVALAGDPAIGAAPAVEQSAFGPAPAWFVRLIDVPSESARVPIAIHDLPDATIVLETDPRNETLDSWNDFNNSLIMLVFFSGQTLLLIYLFIGRALRPLYRLGDALEQIGRGNYAVRIDGGLAPELSRLHQSYDRMAGRLAAADADNRRLNEQLLRLQEEERAQIARDLHDEVGPYLFAINIEASNVSGMLRAGRADGVLDQLSRITESVGHIQRELHGVVRRLHPIGLADFGLREAIGDMIQFWRRRHPEVDCRLVVAPECDALGELTDTAIYRIVQESLSNALRHGQPTIIDVRIDRSGDPDEIRVEITDDGTGIADTAGTGFGLRGMSERMRALGGTLTLSNQPGGGLSVRAILPCRPSRGVVAVPSKGAAS